MEPRIDLITMGVDDPDAAARFYTEGLGWKPTLAVPGEITFFQVGPGRLLSLFDRSQLTADIGRDPGVPVTLAQVVREEDAVRQAARSLEAAGGTVVKPPQHAAFGGFHTYVLDPAGIWWEVATNPGWREQPDGTVQLGPVEGGA